MDDPSRLETGRHKTLRKAIAWIVFGATVLALSVYLLWIWPRNLLPGSDGLTAFQRFTMINEKRRTAVQMLGGFFFVVTAVLSWLTVKAAEKNAEAANDNARIAQRRLDSERFVKATENLGGEKLSTRIGAVYSLESIAHETKTGNKLAVEVLVAFVKGKAMYEDEAVLAGDPEERQKVEMDVEAALRVIGRRPVDFSNHTLIDLKNCNFHNASLTDIDLWMNDGYRHIALFNCVLSKVSAIACKFVGCAFNYSDLRRANFTNCSFNEADFDDANLEGAIFNGATFTDTTFTGAKLKNADFRGADLSGVDDMTQEQINGSIMNQKTELPPGLHLPGMLA